ncbi:MAG TPA: hypothetical protein VI854_00505 [Acidimicrobiia bacterium]|nr:hypothetical protein [Acidimicrobiia bacterium]
METTVRSKSPRRRLVAAAGVLLALAAGGAPTLPVGALEQQPGIRVEKDQTVEREFAPIPGQNPLPVDRFGTPDDCRTAAYCDVIPLEVAAPAALDEAEEFFVDVELTWETKDVPSTPASGMRSANDLDLYVWDDPAGDAEITFSGGETEPEHLRLYRPTKGRYQIVVFNYLGPNTGYRLKVAYKTEVIEKPFESLEPDFEPPDFPVESLAPEGPPVDLSDAPEPEAEPAEPATPVYTPDVVVPDVTPEAVPALPLEPVAVDPDPDFEGFDDADFDGALAAPPESNVLRQRQARVVGPPKPASAGTVLFWLAFVPLLLLVGGGWWLVRRGSAVLRFK